MRSCWSRCAVVSLVLQVGDELRDGHRALEADLGSQTDLALPSPSLQMPSTCRTRTLTSGLKCSSLQWSQFCSLLPDPAESIPSILDGFQSREVKAGQLVELPCIASGYPNPAIRWIKDGRPLPADSRWTKRITGLTISDLRVEDSGTYICEVTNTFGSAEVTGTLMVIGELLGMNRWCTFHFIGW